MESLPRDIAFDILSRLPITSLAQVRRVSRAWRSIAKDTRFASIYDKHAEDRDPSLIIHSKTKDDKKLYIVGDDLIHTTKATRICKQFRIIENMHIIEGSCGGLVCLCDARDFDPKFVINPLTGECIKLPKANQYSGQEITFGFGYHSSTREYKLVRVANYHANVGSCSFGWSDVQILTLGPDQWVSIGRCPFALDYGSSEAFVNESFHWSIKRYSNLLCWVWIVSFDLETEVFEEIPAPDLESHNNFSMLLIEGCLSIAVHLDDERAEIWVMREYNVKESWSKYITIPVHMALNSPSQTSNSHIASHIRAWPRVEKGPFQVLCKLKNGHILLRYKNLVLYDPERKVFQDVTIEGLSGQFITTLVSIHLSPNWIKEVINTSKNHGRKWLPEIEEFFIRLMFEEAQTRNAGECYFDEKTWQMFAVELFKRCGHMYFSYELKSKYIILRRKYRTFAELLKHTKFRWDSVTNKVTANSEFWKKYLKMHPNTEEFESKGYKHYNLLDSIFKHSTPVGFLSRTRREPVPLFMNAELDCWCSRHP